MTIRTGFGTDPGLERPENEDSGHVYEDRAGFEALLVICDGMGGHAAGHLASSIALESFVQALDADGSRGADAARLTEASKQANTAVHEAARENPAWRGMGSTLVAVGIRGEDLVIANVGDSPAYLWRGGEWTLISQDHSWPAEQVRLGLIKPEAAVDHPYKHRLTRAIGVWEHIPAFSNRLQVREGDLVVICSDGVETAGVSVDEMGDHLAQGELDEGIRAVIERCRELGAPDNITIAAARVGDRTPDPGSGQTVVLKALD